MRVALYSSKRPRCGIATYSSYLETSLRSLGVEVRHWGSLMPASDVFAGVKSWAPEIFHVQHEHSIMPPAEHLRRFVRERVARGLKNVITLHTEDRMSASLAEAFQAVLIHRNPKLLKNAYTPQMPCPVYEVPEQRAELRKRHGIPAEAFVISTVGFMLPWKKTVEIAQLLIPWLRSNPRGILQLISSAHFSPDAGAFMSKSSGELLRLSSAVEGRIRHISEYPSDEELLDRLAMSDLGYVYCPFDTGSASAAASVFVSARCPLVVSTSTHYDHLSRHTIRAPKEDLTRFTNRVAEVAGDRDLLRRLRHSNEFLYAQTNYLECARAHLRVYGSILP